MNGAGLKNNGTGETRLLTAKQRRAYETLREFLATSDYQSGDQIASFQQLSEKLGMTVKMLQAVTPLFIADGILEVVPKVGTFLKTHPLIGNGSNQQATPSILDRRMGTAILGKKKLRLCIQEHNEYFAPLWRRIIRAFEEEHPKACIEIGLGLPDQFLTAGDVLFTEIKTVQDFRDDGKFPLLDWMDENHCKGGEFFPVAEDFLRVSRQRAICPAVIATAVVYARRDLLEAAGLFEPQNWRTPADLLTVAENYRLHSGHKASEVYGLALENNSDIVQLLGWGRRDMLLKKLDTLRSYLKILQFRSPPRLLTQSDIVANNEEFFGLLSLMKQSKLLLALAPMWYHPHLDPKKWETLSPPSDKTSYIKHSAMAISVRTDSADPELATALARFITGSKGQEIISSYGAYLPARRTAASRHPFFDLYNKSVATSGFVREDLLLDMPSLLAYRELSRIMGDVRTSKIDIEEAVEQILKTDADVKMKFVKPKV